MSQEEYSSLIAAALGFKTYSDVYKYVKQNTASMEEFNRYMRDVRDLWLAQHEKEPSGSESW